MSPSAKKLKFLQTFPAVKLQIYLKAKFLGKQEGVKENQTQLVGTLHTLGLLSTTSTFQPINSKAF